MSTLDINDFEVLIGLEIADKRVELVYQPRIRVLPDEVQVAIEEAWRSKRLSRVGRRDLIDDITPLYRYEYHKTVEEEVVIFLSNTDYKETYGTNIVNPQLAKWFGSNVMGDGLSVCGVILGADGNLILLHRSENVLDKAGWWHTVGGNVERAQNLAPKYSIITEALEREIREEIPDMHSTIETYEPLCLIRYTHSHKPEFCYLLRSNASVSSLADIRLNFEHQGYSIVPCTLPAITDFLVQNWAVVVESTKAALYHICLLLFDSSDVRWLWGVPE